MHGLDSPKHLVHRRQLLSPLRGTSKAFQPRVEVSSVSHTNVGKVGKIAADLGDRNGGEMHLEDERPLGIDVQSLELVLGQLVQEGDDVSVIEIVGLDRNSRTVQVQHWEKLIPNLFVDAAKTRTSNEIAFASRSEVS